MRINNVQNNQKNTSFKASLLIKPEVIQALKLNRARQEYKGGFRHSLDQDLVELARREKDFITTDGDIIEHPPVFYLGRECVIPDESTDMGKNLTKKNYRFWEGPSMTKAEEGRAKIEMQILAQEIAEQPDTKVILFC